MKTKLMSINTYRETYPEHAHLDDNSIKFICRRNYVAGLTAEVENYYRSWNAIEKVSESDLKELIADDFGIDPIIFNWVNMRNYFDIAHAVAREIDHKKHGWF